MPIPKAIDSVAAEVKARIAARDAEIAVLNSNLADLIAKRNEEIASLKELESAFPALKSVITTG